MLCENVRLVVHDAGAFVTTSRLTKVLLGLNVPPTRSTDAQPTPQQYIGIFIDPNPGERRIGHITMDGHGNGLYAQYTSVQANP